MTSKKVIFLLILTAASLPGCGLRKESQDPVVPTPEQTAEVPVMSQICGTLCERTIPDLCKSEIEDAVASGASLDETIMDEASCLLMCEADWDEKIVACVTDADECAQLSNSAPYCMENSEEKESESDGAGGDCVKACNQYVECAKYTEGVTKSDLDDAFQSCSELCATWTLEQRNCVSRTPIKKAADCAAQSACVLPALKSLMK